MRRHDHTHRSQARPSRDLGGGRLRRRRRAHRRGAAARPAQPHHHHAGPRRPRRRRRHGQRGPARSRRRRARHRPGPRAGAVRRRAPARGRVPRRRRLDRGRRRGRCRSPTRRSTTSCPCSASSSPRGTRSWRPSWPASAAPAATSGSSTGRPAGLIGELFTIMSGYLPAPPPYASAPPLWGSEAHVRSLFAGTGVELTFAYGHNPWRFDSAEHWVAFLETAYGPTVKARERLTARGRWDACRAEIVAMAERRNEATDGTLLLRGRVPRQRSGRSKAATARARSAPPSSAGEALVGSRPISRSSRVIRQARGPRRPPGRRAPPPWRRRPVGAPAQRLRQPARERATYGRARIRSDRSSASSNVGIAASAPVLHELEQPERVRDRSERRRADAEHDPEVAVGREQRLGARGQRRVAELADRVRGQRHRRHEVDVERERREPSALIASSAAARPSSARPAWTRPRPAPPASPAARRPRAPAARRAATILPSSSRSLSSAIRSHGVGLQQHRHRRAVRTAEYARPTRAPPRPPPRRPVVTRQQGAHRPHASRKTSSWYC